MVPKNACNYEAESSPNLQLILLSFIIVSPATLSGFNYGYPSIALPQLKLTLTQASWFGYLTLIGCVFGALTSGFVIDKYGRKRCLEVSVLPSVIGWFLLTINYQIFHNIGRLLTSFTSGATTYSSSTYLAESIAKNKLRLRSSFTTWSSAAVSFGICVISILGSFLSYSQVAFIAAILSSLVFVLTVKFIPESPIWLYKRGRIGDADWFTKCLRLRFADSEILSNTKFKKNFACFARKDVYKPLIITTGFVSFSMLSGGMILVNYMVDIIKNETLSYGTSYKLAIISGILQFSITVSITFILPYTGNRKLAIISGTGMTIGMCIIAITSTLHLVDYEYVVEGIHTVGVWFSITMFSFGFLSMPNALLGELFPIDFQGIACIPTIVSFLLSCVITELHSCLNTESYFKGNIYFFYALMDVLGTIFVSLFVPETVGKTLENIRDGFN